MGAEEGLSHAVMVSELVYWACVRVEKVELVCREYIHVEVRKVNHSNGMVAGR